MNSSYELEIIPGTRIGKFHLGWELNELIKHLDFEYTIEHYQDQDTTLIKSNDFWFTLDKTKGLHTIYASGNFKGKYNNLIGLGTVLAQIHGVSFEVDEEFLQDTMWWRFKLTNVTGIHFVPEKEWDDTTPIRSIHVFY
ncbi:hypothetical protein ACFQ88_24455 [Paenibacillus sp. NPDC056579]|uniref:hypothetical protein n=1 Tax=Paenibacillus sp. NPDC056579 TaxID=3345871 RepID=UPI0036B1F42F